jgi:choline dehydrogenase-like flavoprotein
MILDNLDDSTSRERKVDLCIVGAGAAGLAMAKEFLHSGLNVVILESGGWDSDDRTQALYKTEQTGMAFQSAHTGRFRIFGGTTTQWGGQSLPLSPLDFQHRAWVEHSGWPIDYDELMPYYDRANLFLGVDIRDYRDETANLLRMQRPDLDSDFLDYHFSKWAPQPNLRETYREALDASPDVKVILHANVTDLDLEGNHIRGVRYKSLCGKVGTVQPKYVILATGGLEVPRLLLACRRQNPAGLGNENDLVGRFLQEHPATQLGQVEATNPNKLQHFFNGWRANRRRFSARLSLTSGVQAEEKLLNASAGFLFSLPADGGFGFIRSVIKGRSAGSLPPKLMKLGRESVKCFPQLLRAAYMLGAKGRVFTPGAICEVAASFEQEPNRYSRVSLSEECDELGMPRARIHWCLTRKTYTTAVRFAALIDGTLQSLGIGRLNRSEWLQQQEKDGCFQNHFHDQNHHMGTTRMSVSSTLGVVDTHLKVHSMQNVYIASSAVFPTGGHSNPTLTMLALALRLADHLKAKLK